MPPTPSTSPIDLTPTNVVRALEELCAEIIAEVQLAEARGEVPTNAMQRWEWDRRHGLRLAALRAAIDVVKAIPADLVMVEGDKRQGMQGPQAFDMREPLPHDPQTASNETITMKLDKLRSLK